MKPEYDFKNGERGKFYFPDAEFVFPEEKAENEPEYPLDLIKQKNPDYKGDSQ